MKNVLPAFIILGLVVACQPHEKVPSLPTDGIAQYYDSTLWPFYHGVASGDPLQDRVIIWTRVTPKDSLRRITVNWQVATDAAFEHIINQGSVETNADRDYTVKADVDRLKPGTQYYYRFNALDKTSMVGETQTAPEAADQVNLAVVSCSNYEFGPFFTYNELSKHEEVNAVLHLGDYIYEYGPDTYGDPAAHRTHYPEKEITTLEDYRLRYSQYRLDSNLRKAHQKLPFITVWDDHEIANNSYTEGAQNHQPDEGDYDIRKAAAKQAYLEWLPVRESKTLYRTFDFGQLAEVIMLDERLAGRTAPPDSLNDPKLSTSEMLGQEQLKWFESQLKNSTAEWKVIGNQVIFSYLNWGQKSFSINLDAWDGYPKERKEIEDFIANNQLKNIVFVTGDTHSSWAFEVTGNPFTGYNAATGEGAYAVEFGTTSINSGNSDERFPVDTVKALEKRIVNTPLNPHLKFANLRDHGFMILSLDSLKAQATWYYVDRLNPDVPVTSRAMKVNSGEVKVRPVN